MRSLQRELRPSPTRMKSSQEIEIAERSDEAALQQSDDRITHLVTRSSYERWLVDGSGPITLCGIDMTGTEPTGKLEDCVVCIDLRNVRRDNG